MIEDLTMFCLDVTNPGDEPDRTSVAKLSRRTADALDDLGEVYVYDLLLQDAWTPHGPLPSIAVFYSRHKLPLREHVVRLHDEILCTGDEDKVVGEHSYVVDEEERAELARDTGPSICLNNSYYETDIDSVPKLLRIMADFVTLLGDVHVDDIMLEIDEHFRASVPHLTIRYHRPDPIGGPPRVVNDWESPDAGRRERTVHHLAIKDAKEQPGHLSRPRLLREVADAIDELGDVDVYGLFLHEEHTDCTWIPEHVSFVNLYYGGPAAHGGDRGEESFDDVLSRLSAKHGYVGDAIEPHTFTGHEYPSFRLHNPPAEPVFGSVPTLLRRTADVVDAMKDVDIDELVLHTEVTAVGRVPMVAVYCSRPTRVDKDNRKEWVLIARDAKRRAKKMKKRRQRTKKQERRTNSG
ncbi:hypothetical protein MMAD_22450 [Mycolicibacterium madagascariense]|uniref:Uncharacterized protein n=2 Tax=Mycolicibacterium madagascariense TaxID=212765 RepID=A0A7I7XFH0_9MYCO|nr:hypothetical protein [Mycolicibacterium madagascariense]MCV7013697.1 hypothetical protein [Mycolicibacterium madagascariense]BBZ27950.1 hypothetical protein MMAD_22450 [Mycolicibacterium madagascariense]